MSELSFLISEMNLLFFRLMMNSTAKLLFIQCCSLKVQSYCLKSTFDLECGPVLLGIWGPSSFLAILGIISYNQVVFNILMKTMYEIISYWFLLVSSWEIKHYLLHSKWSVFILIATIGTVRYFRKQRFWWIANRNFIEIWQVPLFFSMTFKAHRQVYFHLRKLITLVGPAHFSKQYLATDPVPVLRHSPVCGGGEQTQTVWLFVWDYSSTSSA